MAKALARGANPDGEIKGNESGKERAAEQQNIHQQHVNSWAELVDDDIEAATRPKTAQSALKESLSRRLLNLFPSQTPTAHLQKPTQPANDPQPSISIINGRTLKAS